jgi:hypothetical protein
MALTRVTPLGSTEIALLRRADRLCIAANAAAELWPTLADFRVRPGMLQLLDPTTFALTVNEVPSGMPAWPAVAGDRCTGLASHRAPSALFIRGCVRWLHCREVARHVRTVLGIGRARGSGRGVLIFEIDQFDVVTRSPRPVRAGARGCETWLQKRQ